MPVLDSLFNKVVGVLVVSEKALASLLKTFIKPFEAPQGGLHI